MRIIIFKFDYVVDFQASTGHAYAEEGGSDDVTYVSFTSGGHLSHID
jgi:hypothetical protein